MTTKSCSELKIVWLHLCKEGGQWTVREIMDALPEVGAGVASTLITASARKFLRAQPRQDRKAGHTFGVTDDCKVPRGVTWKELREAGAFKDSEETA